MTFLIFALSQNGARRNDVFNGFPFSSANPTFINDRLQAAYYYYYNLYTYIPVLYDNIKMFQKIKVRV
jgi:hypothetical protein